MKPNLPKVQTVSKISYNGDLDSFKVFTSDSLKIEHEHASLSNAFALRFSGDKQNGTYVEVGASDWINGNTSYMLEKEFGWKGVGIEIEPKYVSEYNKNRSNPCIHADATTFNWDAYFEKNNFPKQIDFLSIDTDVTNTLSLMNMPLSRYRFSTIVIENKDIKDHNLDEYSQKIQHDILFSYNYILVGSGFSDDFWIDNTYLQMSKNSWEQISSALWHREIKS